MSISKFFGNYSVKTFTAACLGGLSALLIAKYLLGFAI